MDIKHIESLLSAHGIQATHYTFDGWNGKGHVWNVRRGQIGMTSAGLWYAFADYPDAQLLAYSGGIAETNSPEAAVEALAKHLAWASEAWEDYETARTFGPDFEDGEYDAREMYE